MEEQPKIFVKTRALGPGAIQYLYECSANSYVWYYADMILHWRCMFCGELEHKRPASGLFKNEVLIIYVLENESTNP